tara:strand:- start:217 stop:438 length:222 start_codon:yes stop_codon:yes gene_type:complete
MRLEEVHWERIDETYIYESVNLNVLCAAIDQRPRNSSLTAGVRVSIVTYFHDLAKGSGFLNAVRIKGLIPVLI